MNTIHSSSLAYQPAGYLKKPEAIAVNSKQASVPAVDNQTEQSPQQPSSASTPGQIRAALEDSGLIATSNNNQPTDVRAAKALAAYTQTRNQPIQTKIADSFYGIDLYA